MLLSITTREITLFMEHKVIQLSGISRIQNSTRANGSIMKQDARNRKNARLIGCGFYLGHKPIIVPLNICSKGIGRIGASYNRIDIRMKRNTTIFDNTPNLIFFLVGSERICIFNICK